ncbi:MAG: pyridoxal-phosphate dependent enzyme, partial [Pseudomonadota bacterium]
MRHLENPHRAVHRNIPLRFRADPEWPCALLAACPRHATTPLHDLPEMAAAQGIATLWVKDESARMGLGSFKALGGAFAVAHVLQSRATETLGTYVDPHEMTTDAFRDIASAMTFITASAGNHGLSVAAGARIFGAQAVVVLGRAVPEAFAERL